MKRAAWIAAVAVAVALPAGAWAGVPFVNLEGVGGIAFNPLAYPAAEGEPLVKAGFLELAKPRIGGWYVNLNDSAIDWTTFGVATALSKRLELSFGYEVIAIGGAFNVHKKTLGAKALLLEENAFGTSFLPAVSVGAKWKTTTFPAAIAAQRESGVDVYAVATKLVTQLPRPVLLSFGVQSTKEQVTGIIGFNTERKLVLFGNLDVVATSWLVLGAEYKMGADYGAEGGGYVDADYYNFHAGFVVSPQLALAAAYTYAGKNTFNGPETGKALGFGPGFVLSGQYAF